METKATGRRFSTVSQLMTAEGMSSAVQSKLAELREETKIVHQLALLRQAAGLTQEDMAQRLDKTQSAISKLESGPDDDLTLHEIKEYARATGERIGVVFGKPLTHVEAVKHHAFGMKASLESLADIANENEELQKHINTFFSEAFFNILNILAACHDKLPAGDNFEIRFLVEGDALPDPHHLPGRQMMRAVSKPGVPA